MIFDRLLRLISEGDVIANPIGDVIVVDRIREAGVLVDIYGVALGPTSPYRIGISCFWVTSIRGLTINWEIVQSGVLRVH
jgi:hypothetical protein